MAAARIEHLALYHDVAPFTAIASSRVHATSVRHEDVLADVFNSPGWASVVSDGRTKLELKSGRHAYCLERHDARAFAVVVDEDYPVRFVFSGAGAPRIMGEFREAVATALAPLDARAGAAAEDKALKRALKAALPAIAERFRDPSSVNKVADAMKRVGELRTTLHETLLKATERDLLIDDIGVKSKKLATSAQDMATGAGKLKTGLCCRYYRTVFVLTFFVLAVIAVIVIVSLNEAGVVHWW